MEICTQNMILKDITVLKMFFKEYMVKFILDENGNVLIEPLYLESIITKYGQPIKFELTKENISCTMD